MFLIKVSHIIVIWPHLSFGLLVTHLVYTVSDILSLLHETDSTLYHDEWLALDIPGFPFLDQSRMHTCCQMDFN